VIINPTSLALQHPVCHKGSTASVRICSSLLRTRSHVPFGFSMWVVTTTSPTRNQTSPHPPEDKVNGTCHGAFSGCVIKHLNASNTSTTSEYFPPLPSPTTTPEHRSEEDGSPSSHAAAETQVMSHSRERLRATEGPELHELKLWSRSRH
jgi:hypothetical protein